VGNPVESAKDCARRIAAAPHSHIVLLPELTLGGYTCGDLFGTDAFHDAVATGADLIRQATQGTKQLVVFGAPVIVAGALMNCAIAVGDGQVLGIVPKQYLPTYHEFYERRHFCPGDAAQPQRIDWIGQRDIPFGIDLLFHWQNAVLGIEICEDLWVPVPPSSLMALAGANVLLNLSASNETIGKAAWRRQLVLSQSGRCIAAYAYASAGPTESTTDLVFGGHCLIAENGILVGQSRHVGDSDQPLIEPPAVTAAIDLDRLAHDRLVTGTFAEGRGLLARTYRSIVVPFEPIELGGDIGGGMGGNLAAENREGAIEKGSIEKGSIDGRPFVPQDSATLDRRCAEVLAIQAAGLAKRLSRLRADSPLIIGVSGGLDSTLALLVAIQACDAAASPRSRIRGLTIPGFGTTAATLENAETLMRLLGVKAERVDIRQLALDTFVALDHRPLGLELADRETVDSLQQRLNQTPDGINDLVFENVQARLRTFLLMSRGFVLGTGDMSEQALGWSTYNADHMSMYNVNCSIPKTLVRFLVRHVAKGYPAGELKAVLLRIADTPISPELLPPDAQGNIRQSTEATLGAYELHDFFLYHFIRFGASRDKIRYLAANARFEADYTADQIDAALEIFFRRFFANQFKRSCVPDGPKVGSVSLSPRGDWRMPSDADSGEY